MASAQRPHRGGPDKGTSHELGAELRLFDEDEARERELLHNLGNVTEEAIRAQRERGLPLVFLRDGLVIKQFPDGREVVLERVPEANVPLPPNLPWMEDRGRRHAG